MSVPPEYPEHPEHPGGFGGGYEYPASYPPPGYGAPGWPPPGYGQPAYPPPGVGGTPGSRFEVGDAVGWALNQFGRNTVALVVSLLGYAVAAAALGSIIAAAVINMDVDTDGAISTGQTLRLVIAYLLMAGLAMFVQFGYLAGCLDIADGKPVTVGSFYRPRNVGAALLTALLVSLFVGIGAALFIIPGLLVAFSAQFAVPFAIDRGLAPADAVKASIAVCRADTGSALLAWLAQFAAITAGWLLFGVGLLVGFPVAMLIQVYAYRRLSGGWVSPASA